jgi:hypothetical protein
VRWNRLRIHIWKSTERWGDSPQSVEQKATMMNRLEDAQLSLSPRLIATDFITLIVAHYTILYQLHMTRFQFHLAIYVRRERRTVSAKYHSLRSSTTRLIFRSRQATAVFAVRNCRVGNR